MKAYLSFILLLVVSIKVSAQKLDSIYFNLYTDSLKKGTFNYINVEGRYNNGRYLPLGKKELKFSASSGYFEGNSLFVDSSFKGDKILVKATSLQDSSLHLQRYIYIKRHESTEVLPTMNEVLQTPSTRKKPRRG
ncbi:MAG: hypothetical protein J7497_05320 [Chitinophagaceae bacterium]|nr:hypothetical protein [Chitinophagaceae bacterium]